jgi:hypothetical protein
MDTPLHQSLYAQGYEMRKKVVGEDYVAKALEKGSSDFMRPLQQFATVCVFPYPTSVSLYSPTFGLQYDKLNTRLIKSRRVLGEPFGLDQDYH